MTFAELLANARRARGITQRQLAARVGITEATICLYERGNRLPKIDRLLRLAGALNVDAAELLPPK